MIWKCKFVIGFLLLTQSLFAQKDFLQIDIGTKVYLNNKISYEIPEVIEFKSRASETLMLGINYQRKLSELTRIYTGLYIQGTSFRYSFNYNWQVDDSKKEWTRSNYNNGHYLACLSVSVPLAFGVEFPLTISKKHNLALYAGLNFTFHPSSESTSSHTFATFYNNSSNYYSVRAIETYRATPGAFQLFAHIRAAYYFKIPKMGQWNVFAAFDPQITKNTVFTEINLLPETPQQITLRPQMINHNIQLGLGYRLGFIQ